MATVLVTGASGLLGANLILDALNQTNWIKAKAADLLKMNRTTLVEKIKKMQIEPEGVADLETAPSKAHIF